MICVDVFHVMMDFFQESRLNKTFFAAGEIHFYYNQKTGDSCYTPNKPLILILVDTKFLDAAKIHNPVSHQLLRSSCVFGAF